MSFSVLRFLFVFFILLVNSEIVAESLTQNEEALIAHVELCVLKAEKGLSNLNTDVLKIEGMSSSKVRHFLNNVCSMPGSSYLEIGCWKGSTFVAALYQNSKALVQAIGIDNWSEFGGPKAEFFRNCSSFLSPNSYEVYEKNCFDFSMQSIFKEPVNIYFYDGNHSALSQELAFSYYNSILDDVFIAIVDDWNWFEVQLGTKKAFKELEYTVLYEKVMPARWNGDSENWWNGLYIAVIRK